VGWDNPIPSHPIPSHPIPLVPWDATLLKNVPWDGMGWKFLRSIPSHGTNNFLKYPIAYHGTKKFLKVSHGIQQDEYFLKNVVFITNNVTIVLIDASLANSNDISEMQSFLSIL
jgi:hypothetical protein